MKKAVMGLSTLLLTSLGTQASVNETSFEASKETERKMLKSVSADMKKIMLRLESDWEFIGKFLDGPKKAIEGLNLTESEKLALTTRDIDQLMQLGLSEEEVTVAMSGTHRGSYRTR